MRLAHLAGVPVDQYLARFRPEQFDEEVALDRIEGDAEHRKREIFKVGFSVLARAGGIEAEPEMFDPVKAEKGPAAAANMSPQQAWATMAAHYGVPVAG
jgi:hypothetical protein